jgi:hypothetical protein
MLDSLVRVSRRDRQTTHALDWDSEQSQRIIPTDNQYVENTTVTRPYPLRTRLVKIFDRDLTPVRYQQPQKYLETSNSNHKDSQ